MKKVLICLLVLGLLCGCSGAAAPETEPVTEPAATAAATEPRREFSLGTVENNVYTNPYAGYGCEFSDAWSFADAQTLQQLPEDVQSLIEGTEMGDVLPGYAQIFDLAAENVEAYLAVNVVYTALSEGEQEAYAAMTPEQTIDLTLENRDLMEESYARAGMTVESIEKCQVTFLGQPQWAIRTLASSGEIPICMVQVMDYTQGSYGVTLTATSYLEDNTQEVLNLFYAVG